MLRFLSNNTHAGSNSIHTTARRLVGEASRAFALVLLVSAALAGCSDDSDSPAEGTAGAAGAAQAGAGGSAAGTAGAAGEAGAGGSAAGAGGEGGEGGEAGAGGEGGEAGAGGEGGEGGAAGQAQGGEAGAAGAAAGAGGGDANDTGFRAAKDGFGFENYTNETAKTNLTVDGLRALLGDKICASMAGGKCTPTPAAQNWIEEQNKGMDGGHCEGMAVLSLLFYKKLNGLAPSAFGAATTPELQLGGNVALESEIAKWFVTQMMTPTTSGRIGENNSPKEVIAKLQELWAAGETATMAIFKPEYKDGHAIVPYQIIDKGNGKLTVMVYDNNFPKEEREMNVDLTADTWSYTASINPNEAAALYEGNATTKTLWIAPTAPRLQAQDCEFCAPADGAQAPTAGYNEVRLSGQADLLITDENGKKIGYENGKFVKEITDGGFIPRVSADLFADDPEPLYKLPVNTALSIALSGSELTEMAQSTVSVTGPGYVLEVDGVTVAPDQTDTIEISKDASQVTYSTQSDETATVTFGFETAGADYLLSINADGDPAGIVITLKHDKAKGEFSFRVQGSPAYSIFLERIDDNGEEAFSHDGESNNGDDTTIVNYGSWGGNGQPLSLQIDKGSDGTIDETIQATDEN